MVSTTKITAEPASHPLSGSLRVPGDKSISHRAALAALMADGAIHVEGYLPAEDTMATLAAVKAMGGEVEGSPEAGLTISVAELAPPTSALDLGNSGTGMRLLAGVLAGQDFDSELIGDASLSGRPMGRIVRPLTEMGAVIETDADGRPPLKLRRSKLHSIDWTSDVSSAQVKSCVLFAGMHADGVTSFREPTPSRDHTERMMAHLGCPVGRGDDGSLKVVGGSRLTGGAVVVPADPSSAAFHILAATLMPGSDILLRDVGTNALRTGFVDVMRRMGADIRVGTEKSDGGEPRADIRVRSARLRAIDVGPQDVPGMIDEFPALFVAASVADGTTRVSGAAELRVKESDRISVMAEALRSLGVRVAETEDGASITGGTLRGGEVDGCGDHRCAMSLLMAGIAADGPVVVNGCEGIPTSYPGFEDHAAELGVTVRRS